MRADLLPFVSAPRAPSEPPPQRGLALIAVLWIVAALSLSATGLIYSAKQEIRTAARQRSTVAANALADAAMRLVLQQLVAQPTPPTGRWTQASVEFAGTVINVQFHGLNGLIDINNAPPALLAALFQHAANLPAGTAESLAAAVVDWRKRPGPAARPVGFDAPEDLLQVPGFDYGLYARIQPLVSASLRGGGLVNPEAASVAVLTVLAQGNAALASQLSAARENSPQAMDSTQLNAAFKDSSAGRALRMVATVPLGEAMVLQRTWTVALGAPGATALPWRVLDQHHAIAAMPALPGVPATGPR